MRCSCSSLPLCGASARLSTSAAAAWRPMHCSMWPRKRYAAIVRVLSAASFFTICAKAFSASSTCTAHAP